MAPQLDGHGRFVLRSRLGRRPNIWSRRPVAGAAHTSMTEIRGTPDRRRGQGCALMKLNRSVPASPAQRLAVLSVTGPGAPNFVAAESPGRKITSNQTGIRRMSVDLCAAKIEITKGNPWLLMQHR
jgi:hypothetical protein